MARPTTSAFCLRGYGRAERQEHPAAGLTHHENQGETSGSIRASSSGESTKCSQTLGHWQTVLRGRSNFLICVKLVTFRRRCQGVYLPVIAFVLPSGKAVASRTMRYGVPMRDLVADWKKWNRAERVLAVMGTLLMVALPLGLLITR